MLLTSQEICQQLRISRTQFDRFKPELYRFGLFQLDGRRSQYRMRDTDFELFINTKIQKP